MVKLDTNNRILVAQGLRRMRAGRMQPGVAALFRAAGREASRANTFDLGFGLGPRLNAAGRMGHARLAVEMLTDASPTRAAEIATYLEKQNRLRQATEREILNQAIEQAHQLGLDDDEHHGIVLGSAGWHPGVIGIVASRVVERFHKPTIIIALCVPCTIPQPMK